MRCIVLIQCLLCVTTIIVALTACGGNPIVLRARQDGLSLLANPTPIGYPNSPNTVLHSFVAGETVSVDQTIYEKDYCALHCTTSTGVKGWLIFSRSEWEVVKGKLP
jgi:hypothetical protein